MNNIIYYVSSFVLIWHSKYNACFIYRAFYGPKVVFLLITDDQRWCKEVLVPKHRKIDDLYIVSYPSVDENDVNGYII